MGLETKMLSQREETKGVMESWGGVERVKYREGNG